MYDESKDFEQHDGDVGEALALLSTLGIAVTAGGHCLDIGAGNGMHLGALQRAGQTVWCADVIDYAALYEGALCKLLQAKYERNGRALDLHRAQFVFADAMDLPFRDGWFDNIFSFNAFEHIPDPGPAFRELARVLRPGGVAYVTMDPIWTCDTGSHFHHRVPSPWEHLVSPTEVFRDYMRQAGAGPDEVAQFPAAMNGRRLADYERALEAACTLHRLEVVLHDRYAGLASPDHASHPNRERALQMGYSDEELRLRRLRWVLRRQL